MREYRPVWRSPSQFADAQKPFIIKQGEDGMPVAEICRKAGISRATYFISVVRRKGKPMQDERENSAADAREANDRGIALIRQDRLREAAAAFTEACDHDPANADAFSNLGATLRRLGDLEGAIARFRTAVSLRPDFAAAHYNHGNALAQTGSVAEAIAAYHAALKARPDYAAAWNNLAQLLNELERYGDALDACRAGLRYAPDGATLRNNAGNALRGLGRLDEAIAEYRRATALAPGMADAHSNLGLALKEAGDPEAALTAHRRAVELRPDHPATLNNMGTSLQALGHNEEAIGVYERARDLAPDQPATLINLGTAEMDRNRIVVAMDCFTRAMTLAGSEQEIALARKNLGLSMMLSGNLENGSAHYAARWQTREFTPRGCAAPQWDGAPFPDRTLFIHGEQGFGDAIQMVRFAALAKARGGRVVVEARPSLAPLLATADGVDAVASSDGPPPDFDLYLPMFDLLATLKVTLSTIPRPFPTSPSIPPAASVGPTASPRPAVVGSASSGPDARHTATTVTARSRWLPCGRCWRPWGTTSIPSR